MSTVDRAEIRGLVTTLHSPSGAFLCLATRVGVTRLLTLSRVAPNRGRASCLIALSVSSSLQASSRTSRAMAHMKASSSRAIAVTMMLGCLARALRRRKRLHSLTCAFQAMS